MLVHIRVLIQRQLAPVSSKIRKEEVNNIRTAREGSGSPPAMRGRSVASAFGDKFVVFPGSCDKWLFSSHAGLTVNQSNHCTKVQLDKPMNLFKWLTQYGWGITYRSWGEPQTVVPHQCPTPARMVISWKLHHGAHCSVDFLFPMLCSISKILAGS